MNADPQNHEAVERYWKEYVPHKCTALRSYAPGLSEQAYNNMVSFIDSGRMLQYGARDDACYIPSDDLMFQDGTDIESLRSRFNVLRPRTRREHELALKQNRPSDIVTNIQRDLSRLNAHVFPMDKTVIEFDKTRITPEALDRFWRTWGNNDCQTVSQDLRVQLEHKKQRLDATLKRIRALWEPHSKQWPITCADQQARLRHKITEQEQHITSIHYEIALLEGQVRELRNEIASLEARINEQERQIQNYEAQIGTREIGIASCESASNICIRDSSIASAKIDTFKARNELLSSDLLNARARASDLNNDLLLDRRRFEICQQQRDILDPTIAQVRSNLNEYAGLRDACQEEAAHYNTNLQQKTDSYQRASNVYYECHAQLPILRDNRESCTDDLRACANTVLGLADRDQDVQTVDIANAGTKYFSPIIARIGGIEEEINTLKNTLTQCQTLKAQNESEIEELQLRKQEMRRQGDNTDTATQSLQNETQNKLSAQHQDATSQALKGYMDVAVKNKDLSISMQSSNLEDFASIQEARDRAADRNKALHAQLQSLSTPGAACRSECDVSLAQCFVHAGHPEICTTRYAGDQEPVSSADGEAQIQVTIYDQNNDRIKQFIMTRAGQSECIYRSGLQDLNAIEIENRNQSVTTNMTLYFKAGAGGCMTNPQPQDFQDPAKLVGKTYNNPKYRDYARPNIVGGIQVDSTVYRKIRLYRGTDSATFLLV